MAILDRLAEIEDEFCRECPGVVLEYEFVENLDSVGIKNIIIPEGMRGNGVGSNLMTRIVDILDDENKKCELLASDRHGSDLSRLICFYERFGFERTGQAVRCEGGECAEHMRRERVFR